KEKAREYLSRVIEIAPQSEFAQEAEKKLKNNKYLQYSTIAKSESEGYT
ncbi:unnamed protein product, partial [marine sediment metagenome]